MTWEETTVLNFLGETPETWFSRREIARKAIHRRTYEEDPNWAVGAIASLSSRGLVEENAAGNFKFKKRGW
jgi:uncharacterized membrane protein